MQHGEHKCCLWCCKKYKNVSNTWVTFTFDTYQLSKCDIEIIKFTTWVFYKTYYRWLQWYIEAFEELYLNERNCIWIDGITFWNVVAAAYTEIDVWKKNSKKCLKANVEYCNHNHKMLYTYKSQFFVAKTCIIPNVCW